MAEHTHIPGSAACGQWETLLADALDGLLKPEDEGAFTAHMAACPACAALYEEARKGREWLEFLSPEPEAPEGFLEKILAHTGPGHAAGAGWESARRCRYPRGRQRFRRLSAGAPPSGLDLSLGPGLAAAGLFGADAVERAAAAADDGGDGVLLPRVDAEPGWRAVDNIRLTAAAGRPAAEGGALVYGTATDHGLGADCEVLRPFAVCVRSGIECAGAARRQQGRRQWRATQEDATGNAGRNKTESGAKSRSTREELHENPPQQSGNPAVGPAGGEANEFLRVP